MTLLADNPDVAAIVTPDRRDPPRDDNELVARYAEHLGAPPELARALLEGPVDDVVIVDA